MIDALDRKLLGELALDSRLAYTALARNVKASREVVTYRMKRLEEQGIILGYVTDIPFERLGYIGGLFLASVRVESIPRFEAMIQANPRMGWSARWAGRWTHGLSCFGKTLEELNSVVAFIRETFADDLRDSKFLMHGPITYQFERLFGKTYKPKPTAHHAIDDRDAVILRTLAHNARVEASHLALELGITGAAVAARITALEKAGIIRRYGLFLNLKALGYRQYSVWIEHKLSPARARMKAILVDSPHVHFLCEYVGEHVIECGVAVPSDGDLRAILMSIEDAVPGSRVLEAHVVADDIVSAAPPDGLFTLTHEAH